MHDDEEGEAKKLVPYLWRTCMCRYFAQITLDDEDYGLICDAGVNLSGGPVACGYQRFTKNTEDLHLEILLAITINRLENYMISYVPIVAHNYTYNVWKGQFDSEIQASFASVVLGGILYTPPLRYGAVSCCSASETAWVYEGITFGRRRYKEGQASCKLYR